MHANTHSTHTLAPELFLRLVVAGGKTKTILRGERATGSFRFRLKMFTINLNHSQLRPMHRPVRMRPGRMTNPAGQRSADPTAWDERRRPLETKKTYAKDEAKSHPTKKALGGRELVKKKSDYKNIG